jgi:hypothetical protein
MDEAYHNYLKDTSFEVEGAKIAAIEYLDRTTITVRQTF